MSEISELRALVDELRRGQGRTRDLLNRFNIIGAIGKGNQWAINIPDDTGRKATGTTYAWITDSEGWYACLGLGAASFVDTQAEELLGLNIVVTGSFSLIAGDGVADGLGFTSGSNNSWLDYDSLTITGLSATVSLINGSASNVSTPAGCTFTDADGNENFTDAEGVSLTNSDGDWSQLTALGLALGGTGTVTIGLETVLSDGDLDLGSEGTITVDAEVYYSQEVTVYDLSGAPITLKALVTTGSAAETSLIDTVPFSDKVKEIVGGLTWTATCNLEAGTITISADFTPPI